jgi:hypothetical protein
VPDERTGGCQCGKIRYAIAGEPLALAVCHCRECQRQSGSAFGMSLVVARDALRVTGETKSFTRKADSGSEVECVFCPGCGTRLYHLPSALGTVNVKAGTLDDTAALEPVMHVWVQRRQPWVVIPEGARCFEGQPVRG